MQAVLQRANTVGLEIVSKFSAKITAAFDTFAKAINAAVGSANLKDFRSLSVSQEDVLQNKGKLVEFASSDEAGTIMNLFQQSNKLVNAIVSMMETPSSPPAEG